MLQQVEKQAAYMERRSSDLYELNQSGTECSLDIVCFPKNVVIFLNSASSAAALVLVVVRCTHRG